MQCAHERVVDYDLSGSGVPPVSLSDIWDREEATAALMDIGQGYPPTNGSPELREAVASQYEHASADNVIVTNGASEANFMAAWRILERGDEMVIVTPTYLQTWNLAKSWGIDVKPLMLKEALGWQFDPEELKTAVTGRTKAVQVCNPNNPTGAVMAAEQRKALLDSVKDSQSWLLADEVYIGAELSGKSTASLWGHHERTLITNGLCKAYGMPGLRIGWLVGAQETIREMTSCHDYLTLTHSLISDFVARKVLQVDVAREVLRANREVTRNSYCAFSDWNGAHGSPLVHRPPDAGAMCFARHAPGMSSLEFSEALRKEKSVLVVPGLQLGMDGFFRIGLALPKDHLLGGLDRIGDFMRTSVAIRV